MRKIFDTRVQKNKNDILREVANVLFDDENIEERLLDIPKIISPGPKPDMRCCVYKERAIVNERIKLALGYGGNGDQVVQVIDVACDECPVSEFTVGDSCRGCIAHRCVDTCPVNAISIVGHRAVIDSEKCIECGKCLKACPYSAIIQSVRPCEKACKPKAIDMDRNKKAVIDYDKCVACGACVYQCPFGAISDKSYMKEVIKLLKGSKNNTEYKVVAVVAPSIGSQFGEDIEIGQIVSGIKKLGFYNVVEAALGADMVAYKEAEELIEKGFLTSSCCPAFVKYVENNFPTLVDHISHNVSPMVQISICIKEEDPNVKIVFIGPCIAKKEEIKREKVLGIVDSVLTFEELQALFDSREIELDELEDDRLFDASAYGRNFARSGGVADAVREAIKEHGVSEEEFEYNPLACDGLESCKIALLRASNGKLPNNFIEGMACVNGCIGGAACLTHGPKDKSEIALYSSQSDKETIESAIEKYGMVKEK